MGVFRRFLTVLLVLGVLAGAGWLGHRYYKANDPCGQWDVAYAASCYAGGILFPEKIRELLPVKDAVFELTEKGELTISSGQETWSGKFTKDTSSIEIKDGQGREVLQVTYRVEDDGMIWAFADSEKKGDPALQRSIVRLVRRGKSAIEAEGPDAGKPAEASDVPGDENMNWTTPGQEAFSYEVLTDGSVRITDCVEPDGIKELQIPDELYGYTVTSLDRHAFSRCAEMSAVRLPETLLEMEGNPFAGCANLYTVDVDPASLVFWSDGHMLVNKEKHELVMAYGRIPEDTVRLPEDIVSIGEEAFVNARGIEKLAIPETVLRIGAGAFEGTGIREVEMGENIVHIGDYAFGDTSLSSVKLPRYVSSVGANPFGVAAVDPAEDNLFFRTEGDMLISLADRRLVSCWWKDSGTDEFGIPKDVKIIGSGAFCGTQIRKITLPEGIERIEDEAFSGNKYLGEITLPGSLGDIGRFAFSGCTALQEITVPDQIGRIEDGTFLNCEALKTIRLPDALAYIGEEAFSGDRQLSEVNLPGQLTEIKRRAFAGCWDLREIHLPKALVKIGTEAFRDCIDLEHITFPKKLQAIEDQAFAGCESLFSIEIADGNRFFRIEEGALIRTADQCLLVYLPGSGNDSFTLPEGILSIAPGAFAGIESLRKIELSEGLRSIGEGAIPGRSNLSIWFPHSIEQIGEGNFTSADQTFSIPVKCYLYKGTAAQTYCEEHNIEYILLPEEELLAFSDRISEQMVSFVQANDFAGFSELCSHFEEEEEAIFKWYERIGELSMFGLHWRVQVLSSEESGTLILTFYLPPSENYEAIVDPPIFIGAKLLEGEWYLAQADMNDFYRQRAYYVPEGMKQAGSSGRNRIYRNCDLQWVSDETGYDMFYMYSVMAWQNEDGSADLYIACNNGTDQDRTLSVIHAWVEDESLGVLFDVQAVPDLTVEAGKCRKMTLHIPPEQVLTEDAKWSSVRFYVREEDVGAAEVPVEPEEKTS